jgi:NAD-dependent deacetylase
MPNNIFVLTGAGVSAESGLGTFRDKKGEGIWAKFDPMKLATPEAFARNPSEVLAFYDLRRRNLLSAKPNAAHFALARLEAGLAERGGTLLSSPKTSTICMRGRVPTTSCTCMANF